MAAGLGQWVDLRVCWAEAESGVRQELQTWLWTLGGKRCCVLGGAGWDTWCLGRGCTELEAPGRSRGAGRDWKGGVGCQWEVCAGREDAAHAARTVNPPECGCGFQGAACSLRRGRALEGPIRVAGTKRQAQGRGHAGVRQGVIREGASGGQWAPGPPPRPPSEKARAPLTSQATAIKCLTQGTAQFRAGFIGCQSRLLSMLLSSPLGWSPTGSW